MSAAEADGACLAGVLDTPEGRTVMRDLRKADGDKEDPSASGDDLPNWSGADELSQGDDEETGNEGGEPLHFATNTPRGPDVPPPLVVALVAGDALYLPAGWWHDVTSRSRPDGSVLSKQGKHTHTALHLAINMWFFPPDGESLDEPYRTDLLRHANVVDNDDD